MCDENETIIIENMPLNIPDVVGSADIFIWRYHNAPQELKDLSVNGGDEDWLVIMKEEVQDQYYIPFLEEGLSGGIGCCCVDYFKMGDYLMAIGSHA